MKKAWTGAAAAAGIGDPNSPYYPRPFRPVPPFDHGFPIEGGPTDISAWAAGNVGIPYAWSFAAPAPGPHVMIAALTHGEEWSGAHALDRLLRGGVRPARGRLSLVFGNWRAHARWDPAEPNRAFYIDRDLNRVWSSPLLDGAEQGVELERARELRPLLAAADVLIDLHSTQQPSPPMWLTGGLPRTLELARAIGWPGLAIRDMPHAAGLRMRDWGEFENAAGTRSALVVECGQHWIEGTVANAHRVVDAVLGHFGILGGVRPAHGPMTVVETTHSVTAQTGRCELLQVWPDLAVVPEAGALLGHDGDTEIRTPYGHAVLILPNRRTRKGSTAVRFGRVVEGRLDEDR